MLMQMNPRQMRRHLARSVGDASIFGRRASRPVPVDTVLTVLRRRTEHTRRTAIAMFVKGLVS